MTSTYCDLLFVKWAVNSGGIMLQHPVLWQFVSAPFPTKAVVKSAHMISWVMKQRVCFFVFSASLAKDYFYQQSQGRGQRLGLPDGGSSRGSGSLNVDRDNIIWDQRKSQLCCLTVRQINLCADKQKNQQ